MVDKALRDIRVLYDGGVSRTGWGGCVRKEDVLLWAKESDLSIEETFDQIAVLLSRGYMDRDFDWDFCDAAANDLFGVLMEFCTDRSRKVEEPKQFWKFYLAFDYSETVAEENAEEAARTEISEFLAALPQ
ncbi:hypothetical protein [Qipengyuania sphaerica]|uniref:hypothetical protein n=1 Tax=Qipengyuania sphaerica TaxID=2867243 RepID=UPI001C86FA34|nr:hypothetical protein [Qipengyuania sphaerica]MBX7539653.1 hypothetical protein [Qipengyuania sphaerica]